MPLRLPVGEVTALLGPGLVRRRVMASLDESTGQMSGGGAAGVVRLTAAKEDPVATVALTDGVLRVDRSGELTHERVAPEGWGEGYLAS